MARLADQIIRAEAQDGLKIEEIVKAFVDAHGQFSVNIPDILTDIADAKMPRSGLEVRGHRNNYQVRSSSLREALAFLTECAQDHVTVETKTERVILYGCDLRVAFWIDEKGQFWPSGYDHGVRSGNWWKPKMHRQSLHSDSGVEYYSVGLVAIVFDKITHKRASGDTLQWERVREDHNDEQSPIGRLNSFSALGIDPEDHPDTLRALPYSDEAAEFFYKVLIGLCHIAKNLDDFFADKKRLTLAIKQRLALPFNSQQ
jgi:hypothetical protein